MPTGYHRGSTIVEDDLARQHMPSRLEQLQSMLARDPNDAFCTYALALEHAKLGQTSEAVAWFDRTLALDPGQCYAHFHKARAQEAAGERANAIKTLRTGLAQARAQSDMKAAGEIEAFLDDVSGG
jgi:tetratricopeptide (TPR) repeat protein